MSGVPEDRPPRLGLRLLMKAGLAMLVITLLCAASVATAVLLEVKKDADIFQREQIPIPNIAGALDGVSAGGPQTILVLGSDRRFADIKAKIPARSDTMMLIRLDPSKGATAVMNIPRDLKVTIPGKGTATPTPETYNERAIRLWSGPQGAVKSARLNGGAETKVSVEGDKTVLTYPIPGVTGAMAKATLTSGPVKGVCTRNCAERIEVRQGDTVTEFTYSNYRDYNDPEEQLDAFFAGRIVEKRGPLTVLDLTVTRTNTPNLYVVVPVPPAVKAAGPAVPTK